MVAINRKQQTMDGNTAAAHVSYAFTEISFVYPITPSSVMANLIDRYSSLKKRENLFGTTVKVKEMQSEAGAAGALHGALTSGSFATTYTASQGLLLMIPNMYKIAGELLPGVIHVAARTIAGHALSIFGDHSDVYACRQTGFAMLCSNSPQEIMDLSAIAHLCAIKGRIPFLHFFDGFRTSHEIQKISVWDYKDLYNLVDWESVNSFRNRALNPEMPLVRGTAQNDDVFFQIKEASNSYYLSLPGIVKNYMAKINGLLGTNYDLFNYYGSKSPNRVIVAMGSVCETIEETIDYLNCHGENVGLVKVRLYRPFSKKDFLKVIPGSVKCISVLDRTKEPGALGEPLYLDVVASLSGTNFKDVKVLRGRYGLSSKDTQPKDIIAVFENMKDEVNQKSEFTLGIKDDVTQLSLSTENLEYNPINDNLYACKFWGLGSDGTVSANKNVIKIIGDNTNMFVQGYFAYDSKKSGGLTVSHLRFGKNKIKSAYYVKSADFVACHNFSYIYKYPSIIKEIKGSGKFLLNCPYSEISDLDSNLPSYVKYYIFKNKIDLYIIDAAKIAKEIGLGGRVNTILQSAFFKITNIIELEKALDLMKEAALKSYGSKGENIINLNYRAIELGANSVKKISIPEYWKDCKDIIIENNNSFKPTGCKDCKKSCRFAYGFQEQVNNHEMDSISDSEFLPYTDENSSESIVDPETNRQSKNVELASFLNTEYRASEKMCHFVNRIQKQINKYEGNNIPVSEFLLYSDGTVPLGTSAFEKRCTALAIPKWNKENCIQCNMCSIVCPHACIRPFLFNKEENLNIPEELNSKKAVGVKESNLEFTVSVSPRDCVSCGLCANICPGLKGKKALSMVPTSSVNVDREQEIFNSLVNIKGKDSLENKINCFSVKGSQFKKPLLEFSGACAGCGETPYAKLVTQLFGPDIYIANPTGCSSIWGGSFASIPYTKDFSGHGPAWQNSLFEDNAEFGLGIELSHRYNRERLKENFKKLESLSNDAKLTKLLNEYETTFDDYFENRKITEKLIGYLSSNEFLEKIKNRKELNKLREQILKEKQFLSKKATWIFGGDGWAYDIGFGGLDHIFASGENLNILVFDTEVYSNTGGQASKSTPLGAFAQFASSGKSTKKKNLASMAMAYEDVYVASVSLGANMNQCIKAFKEAFDYGGVSLIIAYSPCIEHGIKGGMINANLEQKKAVEAGHWKLFRYNPLLRKEGKDPFIQDSKEPNIPYEEFLNNEGRFKKL